MYEQSFFNNQTVETGADADKNYPEQTVETDADNNYPDQTVETGTDALSERGYTSYEAMMLEECPETTCEPVQLPQAFTS